jgi:hypothetical protein
VVKGDKIPKPVGHHSEVAVQIRRQRTKFGPLRHPIQMKIAHQHFDGPAP